MRTTVISTAGLRLGSRLAALAVTAHAGAATIEVSVVDDQGKPIENVAVYATPAHDATEHVAAVDHTAHGAAELAAAATGHAAPAAEAPTAVMDQHNLQFAPHLLVVQAGTSVTFPNTDVVSHHVYSFSDAKTFELALYKGNAYPPVTFERTGIVVLGCNIHDGMLGYIVVVATPHFAQTNEQGVALIEGVPNGDYVLAAWTPRVRATGLPPSLQVTVTEGTAAAEIHIAGRLAPAHEHGASSLTWERY
jgi:plastocyanin